MRSATMFGRNRKKEISPEDRVEQSDDAPVGETPDKDEKSEENGKGKQDSAKRAEKSEGRPDNPETTREDEDISPHRLRLQVMSLMSTRSASARCNSEVWTFCRICSGVVAPAMTLSTSGRARSQAKASSSRLRSRWAHQDSSLSTRSQLSAVW